MKMLWDDEYLYIGAVLSSDLPVVAEFTERNSPIFQRDSDFEVFVDAAGSCHGYKELEVNAMNVVWNLLLTRPYSEGGQERSGRVTAAGAPDFYDVGRQRTATRVLAGALNDPDGGGATWSVEIALAHSDTLARQPTARLPSRGVRWRINFSRVERRGEINWVWGPQVVWEPRRRRYEGKVNMHLPDCYGLVEFAPSGTSEDDFGQRRREAAATAFAEPAYVAHAACMHLFYASHAYREAHGTFPASIGEVVELVDAGILNPKMFTETSIVRNSAGDGFVATVAHRANVTVTVNEERLVAYREDNLECA
jgi:hypothetical protein